MTPRAPVRAVSIWLPIVPSMALSQNSRAHWGPRTRVKKGAQSLFRGLLLERYGVDNTPAFQGPVALTWRVCFGDRRARDTDNITAALKPWLDVLVPCDRAHPLGLGIIQGDDSRVLVEYRVLPVEPPRGSKDKWTELVIEPKGA